MRKKLLAITLCVMVAVSCMPTLAFAAAQTQDIHSYYVTVTDGYADWSDVQAAATSYPKLVKIEKAPTHSEEGSFTEACHGCTLLECDGVQTGKIAKLDCDDDQVATLTTEEILAKLIAADYKPVKTTAEQKAWTTAHARLCSAPVELCSVCGKIDVTSVPTTSTLDEVATPDVVEGWTTHMMPSTASCAEKVQCNVCKKQVTNTERIACKAAKEAGQTGYYAIEADDTLDPYYAETGSDSTEETNLKKVATAKGLGCKVSSAYSATQYSVTCAACGKVHTWVEGDYSNCSVFTTEVNMVGCYTDGEWINGKVVGEYVQRAGISPVKYDAPVKAGYIAVVGTSIEFTLEKNADKTAIFYKADETKKIGGVYYYGFKCAGCQTVRWFNADNTEVTKTIAALEEADTPACTHDLKLVETAATCYAAGTSAYVCTICGAVFKDAAGTTAGVNTLTAPDHTYTVEFVPATCVADAYYVATCGNSKCAKIYVKAENFGGNKSSLFFNPKKGTLSWTKATGDVELAYIAEGHTNHTYTTQVTLKAATCTTDEIVGYKCDVCGKTNFHNAPYAPKVVPGTKLACQNETVTIASTCAKYGATVEYCKDHQYKPYAVTVDANTKVGTNVAGSYEKLEKDGTYSNHTDGSYKVIAITAPIGGKCEFTTWTTILAPTAFDAGYEVLTCSKCGALDYNVKNVLAKKSYKKATVKKSGKKYAVKITKVAGATKYTIKVGTKTYTKTKAGTYKYSKKASAVYAWNAAGKSIKIK